jgi:L,D-peptidoglycan transpeptidase YkuD (ErfK/YbiS/YcfS/YnhG family)
MRHFPRSPSEVIVVPRPRPPARPGVSALLAVAASLAVVIGSGCTTVAGAAGAPPTSALPARVAEPPPTTSQLVTVTAAGASSTVADLQAWQREPSAGWRAVLGPVRVRVGTAGIGPASEGISRTPAGSYLLTEAFGRAADPGSGLRYTRVDAHDWWVSDVDSPLYNTRQRCAPGECPFDERRSENLYRAGPGYDHAMVIGYNLPPATSGAGSAFFVHVDAGVASEGCVVVPRAAMTELLRWVDEAAEPMITIGAG